MRKILIAMTEIGSGHKVPAIAIKKALDRIYPGRYDIEVTDLLKKFGYNWLFNIYYFFWVKIGMKFPKTIAFWYDMLDNKYSLRAEEFVLTGLAERTEKYVKEKKFDLVLADHETCIHVFSMIKDRIKIPVIAMNTDPFDGHYVWASGNVDDYIVFSEKVKKILYGKGVPKDKFLVFNNSFPLDEKHSWRLDSKKAIRKKLNLLDKKTILMSSGGEGISNLMDFVNAIIDNNLGFQIIFICGRNEELMKELEKIKIPQGTKSNLKVFGFVDNMQEFIQASDIVLGKPGTSQTFETLIKNKPVIFVTYLRNELATLKFVLENGAGWHIKNEKEFIELLGKIEANPKILEDASRKIKRLKIRSSSNEIARLIHNKLKNE